MNYLSAVNYLPGPATEEKLLPKLCLAGGDSPGSDSALSPLPACSCRPQPLLDAIPEALGVLQAGGEGGTPKPSRGCTIPSLHGDHSLCEMEGFWFGEVERAPRCSSNPRALEGAADAGMESEQGCRLETSWGMLAGFNVTSLRNDPVIFIPLHP